MHNSVVHEFGHSFGALADEYVGCSGDSTPPILSNEPNVTIAPDTDEAEDERRRIIISVNLVISLHHH
jgi:hypothetical protein